jgi:RNA polymerase sigma-70 factor, ECF subfamily
LTNLCTTHDATILRRLQAGDVAAFEQVFRSYHASLCEVVDAYVHSQDIAEELVQDLFFSLWTNRERWTIRTTLRAYLLAAARNRALHHLRHEAVVRRWTEQSAHDSTTTGMSQQAPDAQEALELREAALALQRAIAKLPARSRMALVHRWDERMSQAEIAEAMGISVKGVEKLLATAMRHLRRLMDEDADRDRTVGPTRLGIEERAEEQG